MTLATPLPTLSPCLARAWEIQDPAQVAFGNAKRVRDLSEAKPGPVVKWKSRGSGVVYTPKSQRQQAREYARLQINQVASALRASASVTRGVTNEIMPPSKLSKRMQRQRVRALGL